MARIVQLLAHSIEEFDQLRLLTGIGHEVFSPGAYEDPARPGSDLRPPLDVPPYPDLSRACWGVRHEHRDDGTRIDGREIVDWAKYQLPDEVLEWADVLIYHHFEHTWLAPQWPRLRDWMRGSPTRRVVWRTVGQSVEGNERMMAPLRAEGLQIVRYSPKERNIPGYAGEDALIRFYKDPAEFGPWIGDIPAVINVTQNLRERDPYTNYGFWQEATRGLPAIAMGPGSETHGGTGSLTYPEMLSMLRRARAYLYLGTQPASYTLGLIEAMMSGIPVVSIGPAHMSVFPYGPLLFEGHEIAGEGHDDPQNAFAELLVYLQDAACARAASVSVRARAIELFGMDKIASEWRSFLGAA